MSLTLSNSPLREVLVGISINLTEEQLKTIEESGIIERLYPIKRPVIGISFNQLNNSASQVLGGYNYISKDDKETILLDKTRITLSNRNKYKGFDSFIAPFIKILSGLSPIIGDFKQNTDIGLRYINEMILTPAELKMFKISLNDCNGIVDNYGAGFRINQKDSFVNIAIQKDLLQDESYRVIFDIDSHAKLTTDVVSTLNALRKLKNNIFFDNIDESLIKKWE